MELISKYVITSEMRSRQGASKTTPKLLAKVGSELADQMNVCNPSVKRRSPQRIIKIFKAGLQQLEGIVINRDKIHKVMIFSK